MAAVISAAAQWGGIRMVTVHSVQIQFVKPINIGITYTTFSIQVPYLLFDFSARIQQMSIHLLLKVVLFGQTKMHKLPFLFVYKPTLATSRDPKLLSVLMGEVFKTCKLKILGYKPRPYSENSIQFHSIQNRSAYRQINMVHVICQI